MLSGIKPEGHANLFPCRPEGFTKKDENVWRHLNHVKDSMVSPIDGSEDII
jgi:hypothetical protein